MTRRVEIKSGAAENESFTVGWVHLYRGEKGGGLVWWFLKLKQLHTHTHTPHRVALTFGPTSVVAGQLVFIRDTLF